jgi:predicted dehydrogenase
MTSRGPNLPPISYLPTSGGQLRDQTVHFFDLLRWISEDEPEEVYVFGRPWWILKWPKSGTSTPVSWRSA